LPAVTSFVASVVFLRLQDFATRPASEQARLRAQLEAVVAVTTADLAPASRIVLDASDGVAVVVLADPRGALRVAERALSASAAGLPLCAGVNHGALRLLGSGEDGAIVGDGIAVAANIAQFAPRAELRASRAFRDALADAVPGLEASLVARGAPTDAALRRYELFSRDRRELARRRRSFAAMSVAACVALFAAGVGWRIAQHGQQAFVDHVAAKYRATTVQGERYVRSIVQKVKTQ
jgi:hypothetical protein